MQVYNSIIFGASLGGAGRKIIHQAKIIAGYKNYEWKTDYFSKSLNESLSTIKSFKPDKNLIVIDKTKNPSGYDKQLKVILDDKTVFTHNYGNELEFIINLANHIKTGKIL